jgi:NAD+ synthase
MRVTEIVALGYEQALVQKIERLLFIAEYKRRQSAPGVKVTRKNFGRDRRYPITNRFRDPVLAAHKPDASITPVATAASAEGLDF